MIKNIILDFGGVLSDWNPHYIYDPYFGDAEKAEWFLTHICTYQWNVRQDEGRTIEEANEELIARYPEWEKEIRMYYGEFEKAVSGEIPGMYEVVKGLKDKGYRLFGLTNWSAETFPLIRYKYPVFSLLEDIVVSGEEKIMKPAPEIFRRAIARFGVEPCESVFVDDNPVNVRAAEELGIHGIHFTGATDFLKELKDMDMKELKVRKLDIDVRNPEDIPAIFAQKGVSYNAIDTINWPDQYPLKPEVSFAIAHNSGNLLIHYKVRESTVKAVWGHDRDSVWQDSCVEFFCAPGTDGLYYNFETNCIGKLLSCLGPGRTPREFIPEECYAGIRRWASLGSEPFEEKFEDTSWELCVMIPVTSFFKHPMKSFDGAVLRGNFYKCGDRTRDAHYVTWSPIHTPGPDYHRPEYFGKLICE